MPTLVLIMGVAGVGKTTVGRALADRLDWTFLEADEDHSPANVAKMARGEGLTDADRDGWIEAVRSRAQRHLARGENVVLACSALRHAHRKRLRSVDARVVVVHLVAPADVIAERLTERVDHFAGPALLPSQLEDLELPKDALVMDATRPIDEIIASIRTALPG